MELREFKNKNDYSVIFFFENRKPIKWVFVDNVYKASIDVIKYSQSPYLYFNVYARRSNRFIKQFKQGENIEQKPK